MKKLLCIIMDGIGETESSFGNAVKAAFTPTLDRLRKEAFFTTLQAHGKAVGMPSDDDLGNSEVGHNAMGSGQIYDQGAKLVSESIASKKIFSSTAWKGVVNNIKENNSTLHLLGLLSDGNVHSHEAHLHALIQQAAQEKVTKIRLHLLFDGRDVGESSAEIYIERLMKVIEATKRTYETDIAIASGGGRMHITMDRYDANWSMVQRGWQTHVLGKAEHHFTNIDQALETLRKQGHKQDQNLPSFTLADSRYRDQPNGTVEDGDSIVFFNFRGDRAVEISRTFTEKNFKEFERVRFPKTYFAGMLEYDGDLKIPQNYLVDPPVITNTLSEYLCSLKITQLACSETQKFGHVTYFWNGNKSGYIDDRLEKYIEIPSISGRFDQKPEMSALQITDATVQQMQNNNFVFGRINLANGDMVGHTGDFQATVKAIEVVDACLEKLVKVAQDEGYTLIITADHGNADEMYDAKESDYSGWKKTPEILNGIRPKTSHTRNPVPFVVYNSQKKWQLNSSLKKAGLANIAATILQLMELPENKKFEPSLIQSTPL